MSRSFSNRIVALVLCLCLMLGMVPPAQAAELAITSQPKSVYVNAGEKASVSVAATGDNLSYQWYIAAQGSTKFSKSSITKASYSITMSDSNDGRQVYCIVTDGSGASVKSSTVSLNIKETVSITRQPVSASAKTGEKISASVGATGDGLTYQWYIATQGSTKFTKSSITKSTYSFSLSATNNGRQAYCVVTDRYGNTEKSKTVSFTIKEEFAITAQPKTVYASAGETASATVKATGEGLTYQWYIASKGSSAFSKSSIKKATYSLTLSAANNGRQAYCVITDQNGNTLQTQTVSFNIKQELMITRQPVSVSVASGEKATVSFAATGNDLTYTWYFKSATATTFSKTTTFTGNTYSVSMDATRTGRQVYCVVKDRFGNTVTTDTVTLNMKNPLVIKTQPESAAAYAGEKVKSTVSATGDGLTYQWYIASRTSSTFSKSSTKSASYSFTLSASNAGRKAYCVITDKWGNSVTTDTVVFTLKTPLTLDSQPQSVTVAKGKKAVVSLNATGDELTYTWYWAAPGSEKFSKTTTFTGNTYSITMDESRSGRRVYCVIKDKWGNAVTTDIAMLSQAPLPVITKQPVGMAAYAGERATATIKATGEGLTYQWYIASRGSDTFTPSSNKTATYGFVLSESSNGRQAYCVITDQYGQSVKSATVAFTMAAPFAITRQPVDSKAPVGKTATVSFEVTGDQLTYEWYFAAAGSSKFTKTTSFTGNTYSVAMAESRAGRRVYCVVTDITGKQLTTDTVTLMLPDPVIITRQPKDISGFSGDKVTVTLEAQGDDVTYEWYFANAGSDKFSKTSSFTGPSYYISMSAARAGRRVYCVVTDKWGNKAQSDTVTLYMIPDGLIYTVNEAGTYATVTGYEGTETVITIPPILGTLPIHSVTIENNQKLTHLTVSRADTALSFYNCAKLQFADVSGVRRLGNDIPADGLFENCYSLKEVVLPAAPEYMNTHRMFYDCASLYSIDLPRNLTKIGLYMFYGCKKLTDLPIPETVTYIDAGAFAVCSALEWIELPDNCEMSVMVFSGCSSLTSVTLPSTLTAIPSSTFANCTALETVEIPASVTRIDNSAFTYSGITSLDLPAGLVSIENHAFDGCDSLTHMVLPENVVRIDYQAFYGCDNLRYVSVPAGVVSLGGDVFTACNQLTVLCHEGSETETYCINNGQRYEILKPFEITEQPAAHKSVCENAVYNVTFGVSGNLMTYQWFVKKANETDFALSDVTSAAFPVTMTADMNGAQVYCVVTNYNGETLTTDTATLYSVPEGLEWQPGVDTMYITGYTGSASELVIPAVIDGLPVSTIGSYAFAGNTTLTRVTLPDTINSIYELAFSECSNLRQVDMPAGDVQIRDRVFQYCRMLTTIDISRITWWGSWTFNGCSRLTEAVFPSTVKMDYSVFEGTFYDCISLRRVVLPENLTAIPSNMFYNCAKLEAITIPASVQKIGGCAFTGCKSLTEVFIPDTVTALDFASFSGCESLASIRLPASLTKLPHSLLQGCSSLTSIELPAKLQVIEDQAMGDTALTHVVLPETVNYIGQLAFTNPEMKYAVIPGMDVLITYDVFNPSTTILCHADSTVETYCIEHNETYELLQPFAITVQPAHKSVYENADYEVTFGVTGNLMTYEWFVKKAADADFTKSDVTSASFPLTMTSDMDGAQVYCVVTNYDGETLTTDTATLTSVPEGLKWAVSSDETHVTITAYEGSAGFIAIPEIIDGLPVTHIGYQAFYLNDSLLNLMLPSTLTTIESEAFRSCFMLSALDIPSNVSTIGQSAFEGCYDLASLILPDSLTAVSEKLCKDCYALDNMWIPSGVTTIGSYAFQNCSSMTAVTIPGTVTSIGMHAFDGCSSLSEVDIPDSVESIGNYAFHNCTGLVSVSMPEDMTNILGSYAFANCTSLTSFRVPTNLWDEVPGCLLQGCTSLTEVEIPSGITKIGNGSFQECTSLTEVVIPNGVTTIGFSAFQDCSGLTNVTIPMGVTEIGTWAFNGCSSLTQVTLPRTLTSLDQQVFGYCTNLVSLNIPKGITVLPWGVAYHCPNLYSIDVPMGVTTIESHAFMDTPGMFYAVLPDSITSIDDTAFTDSGVTVLCNEHDYIENYCTRLGIPYEILQDFALTQQPIAHKSVCENEAYNVTFGVSGNLMTYQWFVKKADETDFTLSNVTSAAFPLIMTADMDGAQVYCIVTNYNGETLTTDTATLYSVPEGLSWIAHPELDYVQIAYYSGTAAELTIPAIIDGLPVTLISGDAFSGNHFITSVTLPNHYLTIEITAFSDCSKLTRVVLPEAGCDVRGSAFANCVRLTDIDCIRIDKVGYGIFEGCASLKEAHFANNVSAWSADSLFRDCTSLEKVTLPQNITVLGSYTFLNCESLTSVSIPTGVTTLGIGCFQGCTALAELHIPNSVTTLGENLCYGCTKLSAVTLPTGLTSIPNYAFSDCEALITIDLPDNVTIIGNGAFIRSGLTRIALPDDLFSIGDYAFDSAPLTHVVIPEGTVKIGSQAFASCADLRYAVIPEGVMTIAADAFNYCSSLTVLGVAGSTAETHCASAGIPFEVLQDFEITAQPVAHKSVAENATYEVTFGVTGNLLTYQWFVKAPGAEEFVKSDVTGASFPVTMTGDMDGAQVYCVVTNYNGETLTTDTATLYSVPEGLLFGSNGQFAWITGYTGTAGKLTIPEKIDGLPVTMISPYALDGCATLSTIELPETLTYIDSGAFRGCTALKSMVIPDSATYIGDNAFNGCTALTSVTLPEGIQSIPSAQFAGCTKLTSIDLPDTVTSIGHSAFECTGLTGIDLPEGVTAIYDSAFERCDKLTAITLPTGLKTLGAYAFQDTALTEIIIPEGVTTIGNRTFYSCNNLVRVQLHDKIAVIGDEAFFWTAITDMKLPESLVNLGSNVFNQCFYLRYVVIPDSVSTFGGPLHSNANEVHLTVLCHEGSAAEDMCLEYEHPYEILQPFAITEQPVSAEVITGDTHQVIFTATGNLMTYNWYVKKAADADFGWVDMTTESAFPLTMTADWDGAEVYCVITNYNGDTLQTDTVMLSAVPADYEWDVVTDEQGNEGIRITKYLGSSPDVMVPADIAGLPVREIGNSAFAGNAALEQVILPAGVTAIGKSAFEGCRALTAISLPATLSSIGIQAFFECSALTAITLPEGVKVIENNTFAFCSALESINLPSTLTAIQYEAFYGCSRLATLTLPANVSSIGTYAFSESGLTRISLPGGIKAIEAGVFHNCFELAEVVIPDTVTSIGSNAFAKCSKLTHVDIPDGVTSIGSNAFDNCSDLADVVLPDSVTSIGSYAFVYCASLETVRLSRQLQSLGDYAFSGCSAISTMVVPKSVTTIGTDALPRFSTFTAYVYANTEGYDFVVNNANYAYNYVVMEDLAITSDLSNKVFTENQADAAFVIQCTGNEETYQWYCKKATDEDFVLQDADRNFFSFKMTAEMDKAQVYCVVTDMAGDSVTSATVTAEMIPSWMSYTAYDSYVSVTYSGTASSVTVPDTLLGLPVRKVYVTTGNDTLESITLPNTALALEASSFKECVGLKSVYIGQLSYDSSIMSTDGREVFMGCTALETVTIGSATKLRLGMFENCTSLKNVTLPEGLTTIDGYAFRNCSALETITLPSTVNSIGYYAFHGSGLKELIIPNDQMTTLGESVLGTCSNLTYLKLPAQLKYINETFAGCPNLTRLYVPATVTRIADKAFTYHDITIYCHENSTAHTHCVDNGVNFVLCDEEPVIQYQPTSVTADRGAVAFTSVDAKGAMLTYQWYQKVPDADAFVLAEGETGVSFQLTMEPTLDGTQVYCVITDVLGRTVTTDTATLSMTEEVLQYSIVGVGSSDLEVTITGVTGKPQTVTIPPEIKGYPVTTIGSWAFEGNANLTMLSLPDTLTTISDNAFYHCTALRAVHLPASLKTIGYNAFGGCTSLWSVELPSGLTTLGKAAFCNTAITHINIPAGITTLDDSTFRDCTKLFQVTFSSGSKLKTLGSCAFEGCSNLESITLPSGVTVLGNQAFRDSGIKTVDMPYVTHVNVGTFQNCQNLTYVNLPNCILLNDYAFYQCSNLSSASMPKLQTISHYAFCECSSLSNFTLASSVNWMGTHCFEQTALTEVNIPSALTSVPSYAFYQCANLKTVTIPSTVTTLYDYAFAYCDLVSVTVKSRNVTFPCELVSENSVFYQSYDTCTFYVYKDSTMHTFCTEWDFTYELL